MKQFFHQARLGRFVCLMVYGLVMVLFCAGSLWGEVTSGMSLTLNADEQNHPDLRYLLGVDSIKLTIVIKNKTPWPINTDRGFSQVDLHRALIITDPNGTKHSITDEGEQSFDVLPSISLNQIPTTKAEILPGNWVRSVVITDVRTLFPMMNTTPGWYGIEARQPFVRFAWTIQAEPLGLLGPQTDPNNWDGTVNSNKLQIFIEPPQGAQIKIQVLDNSVQPAAPIAQVPVRVLKTTDILPGNPPPEIWDKTAHVLEGTTSPEGWAVWDSEEDVQCLTEDEYVVMALYSGEYEQAAIAQGPAEGWLSGCDGLITKELYFGEPAVGGRFSIFALNSIWLRDNAVIYSGDVAARDASTGGWLDSGVEVSVTANVNASDGVKIMGDSVKIAAGATVDDVHFNDLTNLGTIRGQQVSPLALPVWDPPAFPQSTPGTTDVYVNTNQSLAPGAYANVTVYGGNTLTLTGGTYHFNFIEIKSDGRLECAAAVEVRVKNRFECDQRVFVGPAPATAYSAKDVVFYVGGINESSTEWATEIDLESVIKANIYSPNGTLYTEEDCEIEGSFIGKDVQIGMRTTVRLDSAFAYTVPGDMDGDGDVDGRDLALFVAAYTISSLTADLNSDGSVDAADVGVFAGNYGQSGTQSGIQSLQSPIINQSIQGQSVQPTTDSPIVIRKKIKIKDNKSKTTRRD